MSVYAIKSKLRDIKCYTSGRQSKYVDKVSTLHIITNEDLSTINFVLDTLDIPTNSVQEVNVIKTYTKLLVEAAHYGLNIDATYWAYYNLLHKN